MGFSFSSTVCRRDKHVKAYNLPTNTKECVKEINLLTRSSGFDVKLPKFSANGDQNQNIKRSKMLM